MERFLQSFFNGAGSILSAHLLGVSPNRAQSAYEGFRSVFEGTQNAPFLPPSTFQVWEIG